MPGGDIHCDVIVVGGGIAGLWTLCHLARAGYAAVLVTRGPLGAGQTIASQGIIHGGIKYALTGTASAASRAIAEMPEMWRSCLNGTGEIDLRGVRVLSPRQFLWTSGGIGSKLAGVAASKAIRTPVRRVKRDEMSEAFEGIPAKLDLYAVDEPILDARTIVESLVAEAQRAGGMILATDDLPTIERDACVCLVRDSSRVIAPRMVLCAGAGNQQIRDSLSGPAVPQVHMQRRPLHMPLVRSPRLPAIFGHCVGLSDKPRVTITSHTDRLGTRIWYVGGQIAEQGVELAPDALIDAAKLELRACIPWVGLDGAQWSTLRVDRAEGMTPSGSRPDVPVVVGGAGSPRVVFAWPTKLAFAPLVARMIGECLDANSPARIGRLDARITDTPTIAPLPWDEEARRWT